MCKLNDNKSFVELADLGKDKQEQINLFLDKKINRSEANVARVAAYLGFVTEKEKNILLQKEAFAKVNSASMDFNDLVNGNLKKEEMPKANLGVDGVAYPVNTSFEKSKVLLSVGELSEAMTLLYETDGSDHVQDAYFNASVSKGFEAAERLFNGFEKGSNVSREDRTALFNGFAAVIEHVKDEKTKKMAGEFLKNRRIEINSYGISKQRLQQATR